jgi:hypothetical protein
MKILKVFILFLSLLSIDNNKKINDLVFNVSLRGSYDLPQAEYVILDSLRYFLVDARLTNYSGSEKKFISYMCTTVGNIVTDNKFVEPCINNCGSNYATTFILKPGQELHLPIIVQLNNKYLGIEVRFGWIFMDYESKELRIDKFFENSRKTHQNVLWSEPIRMELIGSQPYDIR